MSEAVPPAPAARYAGAMTLSLDRFDVRLEQARAEGAPGGRLELIVGRPAHDERVVLGEATLDSELGLIGDRWGLRAAGASPAYLAAQLTVMSTRILGAIEPDPERWPLAGDQLYVDLELGEAELPAGSRLALGSAVIEVSAQPHTGCAKFSGRFGADALRWIDSAEGRAERRRGMNARIIRGGTIRVGDAIRRV